MEKGRRDELVNKLTHRRDGSVVEFVTVPLEVGKAVTFKRIGDTQTFNGNDWTPVEAATGERISFNKIMYARGLQFTSNKIEDRPVIIDGVEQKDAEGKPQTSKRYTFNKELVG